MTGRLMLDGDLFANAMRESLINSGRSKWWFLMFRFETTIARNSRAMAKISNEEVGIRDAKYKFMNGSVAP